MPIDPHDISTIRNLPEVLPPPAPPAPLVGEVKEGAAYPGLEAVSVLANKPDHTTHAMPAPLTGEVAAGASLPGEAPPSVQGTSQAPKE